MNFWITGRAGAGKSTLAQKLAKQLQLIVIDGDDARDNTGNRDFSYHGQLINLRYMTDVALGHIKRGRKVVIACISPDKAMRRQFQRKIPDCVEIQLPGGTMWKGTDYEE